MFSRRLKRTALALLASGGLTAVACLAGAGPQREEGWGLPRDASLDGHRIDWLIEVTMVFVVILFVIMCVWMLWACIKHREGHTPEYDHGDAKHQVRFAAGLSAVIFFVVDGNLWVNSTIDVNQAFWNFEKAEGAPNALRVEVNAHQWAWDFRYPGPDQKFNTADDIVMMNELVVPADAPVILQMGAADVIHSFYLPNFRIKQDAVPGMINRLWFHPKQTGQFDIGCAQHCGTNHYKMKGTLTVLSADEYAKWAAEASANAARAFDPNDEGARWGWDWRVD